MTPVIYGIGLVIVGSIYVWKPTIFRRGLWMKTSIAIRTLSETNYTRSMRGLGVICVVAGIALILGNLTASLGNHFAR
jgi:hypothetical protein